MGRTREIISLYSEKLASKKCPEDSFPEAQRTLSPPGIIPFDLEHMDAAQCLYTHYPPNAIIVMPRTVRNTRNTQMNRIQFLPSKSLYICRGERQQTLCLFVFYFIEERAQF